MYRTMYGWTWCVRLIRLITRVLERYYYNNINTTIYAVTMRRSRIERDRLDRGVREPIINIIIVLGLCGREQDEWLTLAHRRCRVSHAQVDTTRRAHFYHIIIFKIYFHQSGPAIKDKQ